jgi:hypothetical protein
MKNKLIVCYSTNRNKEEYQKFNKHIKQTSGLKTEELDILTCVNTGNLSLTEAYNKMWKAADYDDNASYTVLLFIHHDVHFKTKGWGKTLLNLYNNNDIDIIGLAGTDVLYQHCAWWLNGMNPPIFNNNDLWGKVFHTDGKNEWSTKFSKDKKCDKLQPVVAIDGVFISVNPETCEQFDEEYKGFHLYDISFCIKNFLLGKKIAVTETIPLLHDSGGALSQAWEDNRLQLTKQYELQLPMIAKRI